MGSAECLVKNDKYNYDDCNALKRKKCIGEALCTWNKSKVCSHVCYNRKNKRMCHTQRFNGEICASTHPPLMHRPMLQPMHPNKITINICSSLQSLYKFSLIHLRYVTYP